MPPVAPGSPAPVLPRADLSEGGWGVFFYKVTCPTCQMSAPVAERLFQAVPERFVAVAQDPAERVAAFAGEYGTTFSSVSEPPPYEVSTAYGVRTVPTLFLVRDGLVADVVESWDRDGWNRLGAKLSMLAGGEPEPLSWDGDGLPPFRPG